MKIEDEVKRLTDLIAFIKRLDNAEKVAGAATSSYARVNLSANSSNYEELHGLLSLAELTDITHYIHDKISEKKSVLEDELNSHIISKRL